MKALVFAACLVLVPVLSHAQTAGPRVVRQYVNNAAPSDWLFDGGWAWNDGALTHYPGATGAVQQTTTVPVEPGRTYRIKVSFRGRTKGSVTVGFAGVQLPNNGANGTWTLFPVATSAASVLSFNATTDYDGAVAAVTVVELGPELVDASTWTVPEGWTAANDSFRGTAGTVAPLENAVAAEAGRTYRVYFGVAPAASPDGPRATGSVSFGQVSAGWFDEAGGWTYANDVESDGNGRLAFIPSSGNFTGAIGSVSVREITTDAPVPPAAATPAN